MKKTAGVLCLCLCLLLCACSKGGEIQPRLCGISFTAELTYYNEVYTFDATISEDAALTAVISSPETLSGLELTVSEEGTTARYKGLTYSAVEGSMPFSSIIDRLYRPVRELALSEAAVADRDGRLSLELDGEEYLLTVSPTGLPQKLELPKRYFTVNFYNVSIEEDVND